MERRPTPDAATGAIPSAGVDCRLAHVAVNTGDLDRFVHFYAEVLGLGAPRVEPGRGAPCRRVATWSTGPELSLVVFELPGFTAGTGTAIDHLGFAAADPHARAGTIDRLVATGHATGEQSSLHGRRSMRFTDPDGTTSALVWPELLGRELRPP